MSPDLLASSHWVWEPHPFIVQFTDTIGLRWYGASYLVGLLAGFWLLREYSRRGRSPLKPEQNIDLIVYLAFGVFLGGRLGYFLLYEPQAFLEPLRLLKVWEGGMASHGGFLGVTLAAVLFARMAKVSFRQLADLAATATPPGLFFGRVANFLNAELWGKESDVPWAVIFRGTGAGHEPRHPSQLYEGALEGLLLFAYLQLRFWRSRTAREHPGQLAGEFLLGYAAVRIFCELFREPDASLIRMGTAEMSRGTFYSLLMILAGVAFIVVARLRPAAPTPAATPAK